MHHGTVSPEIAKGLLALRERIKESNISASKLDESINIATWNIHINDLFPGMNKTDFTYQMSDHLPLWMQMNIDIDGFELEQTVQGRKG